MGHNHSHAPAQYNKAFALGIILNLGFVIVEFVFGQLAHSMALVADAGHNLSDVLSLALAWGAAVLTRRKPTLERTYGLRRSSILAALTNAVILLIALGAIALEAIQRFTHPQPIATTTVIWVAMVGILINGSTALLFLSGRKADLNVRGAYLHMVADAAVSLGVVIAGLAIWKTGWLWIDPLTSLAIAAVIFVGTWNLLRDSVDLALDAVPKSIDIQEVRVYLENLPEVRELHDLHIWGMSTTEAALTAHLVLHDAQPSDAFLAKVTSDLHERFGIEHATLQTECGDLAHPCHCRLASQHS